MSGLRIHNLSFSYGQQPVLKDCTLDAPPGEITVIVGPSGCGKTTFLRTIAGALTPQAGVVKLWDVSLLGIPTQRRAIAFIMDDWGLYPNRSVTRNIAFPLEVRRTSKDQIRNRVHAVASRLGLADLLDRKPHELSAGQRQRVAIARVLVRGSDVRLLLADEPWSNLDQSLRHMLRAEFRSFCKGLQIPAILVSHDQGDASIADSVVVMCDGTFVQSGPPLAVYRDPDNIFVAEFFAPMQPNIMPQALERQVHLFRPEHAELVSPNSGSPSGTVVDIQMMIPAPLVLLEMDAGGQVRAICNAHSVPDLGSRRGVRLKSENLLRFDKTTGIRVRQ